MMSTNRNENSLFIFFFFYVSVIRCRDLYRSDGSPVNAYVKVSFQKMYSILLKCFTFFFIFSTIKMELVYTDDNNYYTIYMVAILKSLNLLFKWTRLHCWLIKRWPAIMRFNEQLFIEIRTAHFSIIDSHSIYAMTKWHAYNQPFGIEIANLSKCKKFNFSITSMFAHFLQCFLSPL